ncbi:MAG: hypothetical protein JNJ40_07535 [Bacteroidia bacterium]|nr:hypothetical protein [Bacteroidia bacterium]
MGNGVIITNDLELHQRIMKLNYLKEEQELVIKRNVREVVYSMHPSVMFKNIVNKFSEDKESTDDLKSIGLNLGKDFLISKLFGKGGSLKGFISSLLIRKATDYVLKNHSDLIVSGIQKVEGFLKEKIINKENAAETAD